MPTYVYLCVSCDAESEGERSIAERHMGPRCPSCGRETTLAMSAPMVVFQGPGWRSPTTKDKIRRRAADHAARGHQLPPKPTYRIRFPRGSAAS